MDHQDGLGFLGSGCQKLSTHLSYYAINKYKAVTPDIIPPVNGHKKELFVIKVVD
jgi:hypothetical protein